MFSAQDLKAPIGLDIWRSSVSVAWMRGDSGSLHANEQCYVCCKLLKKECLLMGPSLEGPQTTIDGPATKVFRDRGAQLLRVCMRMQTDAWGVVGGPGPLSSAVEPVPAADVLGAVVGRHGAHLLLLLLPLGHSRLLLFPGASQQLLC